MTFYTFTNLQAQEFNGYWEARGNGLFAEITDNQFGLYSYTSNSLIPIGIIPLFGDQIGTDAQPFGELSIVNDVLHFSFAATVDIGSIRFDQVPTMPALTQPTDDPTTNFEIFWTMFEEYGCLFDILDVDWQGQYDLYAPQIDENTSDSELFGMMTNMISLLNDGHTFLVDTENQVVFGAGPTPTSIIRKLLSLRNSLICCFGVSGAKPQILQALLRQPKAIHLHHLTRRHLSKVYVPNPYTDQPQGGKAHRSCHLANLSKLAFLNRYGQPAGRAMSVISYFLCSCFENGSRI